MASARPKKQSAGDLTGRKLAEEQSKAREAEEDRSKELAMATAARKEALDNGIFDPATGARLDAEEVGDDVDDLTVQTLDEDDGFAEVDVENVDDERQVIVRIAENVKFCLGQDEWYDLKGGQKYRLPESTATYLDEKGMIWH